MKKFKNIFIHDVTKADQYVFVVDNQCYYKFNGKYAIYEYALTAEKKEYAQRLGNVVDVKQVYGLFSGACPECQEILVNAPVVKKNNVYLAYCDKCATPLTTENKQLTPLVNVLEIHQNRKDEIFEYEELDLTEEEKE